MRGGSALPDEPRILSTGFYVPPHGANWIDPFQALLIHENPDLDYPNAVSINVDGYPPILLTLREYNANFRPLVDRHQANIPKMILELNNGDREIDGTWWTGTREQAVNAHEAWSRSIRPINEYDGGRRRRSHKKRSSHKKRRSHKKRSSGHKKSHRRH